MRPGLELFGGSGLRLVDAPQTDVDDHERPWVRRFDALESLKRLLVPAGEVIDPGGVGF